MIYPDDFINKIICGDCLKIMELIPDKSIDLVLTDPPYNAKNIGPNQRVYDITPMIMENYVEWCGKWFKQAERIGKVLLFTPGIANTHNYPQPYWQLCWHKPAAVSFNRMGGFNAWEPIFIYGKKEKGERCGQDFILHNTMNFGKGPEKKHPCPKPLGLWHELIIKFSDENDIILDPFMGSGTTAVGCKNLNRKYIGIEISKQYVNIAEERLKQEVLF